MLRHALTLMTLLLLAPGTARAAPGEEIARWTVLRDSVALGSSPVHLVGEVPVVDVLSFCDALAISYHRDDQDRHVLYLPGSPVVFIPDGAFVQVGVGVRQLAVAPYREGYRFFAEEEAFLRILEELAPGELQVDRKQRFLHYRTPSSDVVGIEAYAEEFEWTWRFLMARPLEGQIRVPDTSHVVISLPEARLGGAEELALQGDRSLAGFLRWEPERGRAVIATPRGIKTARLEGPDVGNALTVSISLLSGEEPADPLAYGDRLLSELLAEERERWKIDRIVIDPGHGGKDPGAIGAGRTLEKDVVLAVSLALRDMLRERLPEVEVIMTRDRDIFIPLGERTRIANRVEGKLFISVHANANRDRRARGQEVYFLSPARNDRAMQVALKENSVIRFEEGRKDYPDLTDERFIITAMAQSQYTKESELFASRILEHMSHRTGLRSRGVDQAGFYVLVGASMPAVLVETAFISNPKEERLLRDGGFRRKLASGIADGVESLVEGLGN